MRWRPFAKIGDFKNRSNGTTSHTIAPNELPKRGDVDPAPHHGLQQSTARRKADYAVV